MKINKARDIGAPYIANGMGDRDDDGSYIKMVVYVDGGWNRFLISEGQAELLAAELNGLVAIKRDK